MKRYVQKPNVTDEATRSFVYLPDAVRLTIVFSTIDFCGCCESIPPAASCALSKLMQKSVLGKDRLRVCTEASKHGRMFICFVALILASYVRHIRDTKEELRESFPSTESILEEMRTIRCIEHDNRSKFIACDCCLIINTGY